MSLEGMIREAEKSLGLREPNHIQIWYRERNGPAFAYNFPWCNAAITYWATMAGERDAVLFGTDYAYTVWHAQRFKDAGQWHGGTKGIRRGDIVFFDWSGSREIGRIDHVGIVTGVSGSNIFTIEGNTENVCARRVRTAATIAGYGRPKYKAAAAAPSAGGARTYIVQPRDTLSGIAKEHRTTTAVLTELNNLADPDRITAGQVLKLPAATRPQVSLSRLVQAAKEDPPKKGSPVSYDGVRPVEDALVAEGLLAARYADGHLGTATRSAYALWQQRLGYTGDDADGIPGQASLTRLGQRHGFDVIA